MSKEVVKEVTQDVVAEAVVDKDMQIDNVGPGLIDKPTEIEDRGARSYVSANWRATFLITFFILNIWLDLMAGTSDYYQIRLLSGNEVSEAAITANDNRQEVIGTLRWLVYLSTSILFLIWVFRAYRNLSGLGGRNLKYSEWWAVGGFFVPIVNFFRPFQVVNEVWKASDPGPDYYDGSSSDKIRTPALTIWWWGFWLAYNLVALLATRLSTVAETADDLLDMSWVNLLSDLFSPVATLLAMLVVSKIDRWQDERNWKLIAAQEHSKQHV